MAFPPNTSALDACVDMTPAHGQLKALGLDTILRYGAAAPWKCIGVKEAKSMQEHGLPVTGTFWPYTLGQQLAASSVPVVLTAAQLTTLTPPTTVTANLGTLNGAATAANQTATQPRNMASMGGTAINSGCVSNYGTAPSAHFSPC